MKSDKGCQEAIFFSLSIEEAGAVNEKVVSNDPYGTQMDKSSKSHLLSTDQTKNFFDSLHIKLRDLTEETESQFNKLEDQISQLTHGFEKNQVSRTLENASVVYIGDGSLSLNSRIKDPECSIIVCLI